MCSCFIVYYKLLMTTTKNIDNIKPNNKKPNRWSKLPYAMIIAASLAIANPPKSNAHNSMNYDKDTTEIVADSNIIANIAKRTWVDIPEIYRKKLEDFISNSKVMQDDDWRKFTEDFIVDKMKSDRGIKKENQELFIRDCIYEKNTWKNIYEWEDWDEERLNEYEEALDYIEQAWKDYIEWFNTYMQNLIADAQQRSANAQQRSTNAQQRSTNAQQRSAEADQEIIKSTKDWLNLLIEFFNLYKKDPSSIKQEQIEQSIKNSKRFIQNCKLYNIDYKDFFIKGLWNKTKAEELMRFFEIE